MVRLGASLKGVSVHRPQIPASPLHVRLEKHSLGMARSGEKALRVVQSMDKGDIAINLFPDKKRHHRKAGGGGDRRRNERNDSRASQQSNDEKQQEQQQQHTSRAMGKELPTSSSSVSSGSSTTGGGAAGEETSTSREPPVAHTPPVVDSPDELSCALCNDSSYAKRDQLVPCQQCKLLFHTQCFGARRIPFTIKSVKERTNRSKYIAKHYGEWACPQCQPPSPGKPAAATSAATSTTPTVSQDSPHSSSSGGASASNPSSALGSGGGGGGGVEAAGGTSSPTTSAMLLSSSATAVGASSPGVGPPSDGTTLSGVAAIAAKAPAWVPSFQPSGKVAYQQSKDGEVKSVDGGGPLSSQDDVSKLMSLLASSGITLDELLKMDEKQQKEALISAATSASKTDCDSSAAGPHRPPPLPPTSATGSGSSALATKILTHGQGFDHLRSVSQPRGPMTSAQLMELAKADARYSKYIKMFQVGLPMKTIEDRMHADGLDPALTLSELSAVPPASVAVNAGGGGGIGGGVSDGNLPSAAVGTVSTGNGPSAVTNPTSSNEDSATPSSVPAVAPTSDAPAAPPLEEGKAIFSEDDPKFAKYFAMLKVCFLFVLSVDIILLTCTFCGVAGIAQICGRL